MGLLPPTRNVYVPHRILPYQECPSPCGILRPFPGPKRLDAASSPSGGYIPFFHLEYVVVMLADAHFFRRPVRCWRSMGFSRSGEDNESARELNTQTKKGRQKFNLPVKLPFRFLGGLHRLRSLFSTSLQKSLLGPIIREANPVTRPCFKSCFLVRWVVHRSFFPVPPLSQLATRRRPAPLFRKGKVLQIPLGLLCLFVFPPQEGMDPPAFQRIRGFRGIFLC